MNFSELETLMSSRGITTLAEIARTLNTTPQAVSNWKARDQVPHHIAAKLSQLPPTGSPQASDGPPIHSSPITHHSSPFYEEDTISLSDILLILAEQLKVIVLIPFIAMFLTFTYVQFIQLPIYKSSSTILLPKSKVGSGGLAGLASQFGVNVTQGTEESLSNPSLFPELIKSRTFAERILDNPFYTEIYERRLPLLAILTYGEGVPKFGRDTLIQQAMSVFRDMVNFESQGSFSLLTVEASDPRFARDLNKVVLDELQKLNRYFKSRHVGEKINFIDSRIASVEIDLKRSEQTFKAFLEQNRQISSPALQLEQERLSRGVEIQKGVYLTLKQQLELAKIEEIQEASIVQVLDEPHAPLGPSNKNLKINVLLAGVLGLGLGIMVGFIRSYLDNNDIGERSKLRRVRNFIKKKGKDIILDRRVSGIVSFLLLIGLPFYLSHESKNPVFFGMYSAKLMLVNAVYILVLLLSLGLFIYNSKKK